MNRLVSRLGTRSFTSHTRPPQVDWSKIGNGIFGSMCVMGGVGGLGGTFYAGMSGSDPFAGLFGGAACGFFYPVLLVHIAGRWVQKNSERKGTS